MLCGGLQEIGQCGAVGVEGQQEAGQCGAVDGCQSQHIVGQCGNATLRFNRK